MSWSSELIQPGYERCLVGFDVRELRKAIAPASLSTSAWNQAKAAQQVEDTDFANGLNLFIAINPLRHLRGDLQVVAFDLPSSQAIAIASTFGLRPLPLSTVEAWSFLGFDVVDPRTQLSAIYDLAAMTSSEVLLNESGLIDDETAAIKAALSADTQVPEHAPFCPCGVWLKTMSESV